MLSRRWLINGMLLLSIGLVVFLGLQFDRADDAKPGASNAGIDFSSVDRVEIRTANQALSLQRRDNTWKILEPRPWPAHAPAVERLFRVADISGLQALEFDSADLARLGLDPPLAEAKLGDISIRFGTTNNIGARRYTMIGSELFLLPDVHLPFLSQGLPGYADRRLLPPTLKLSSLSLPGLSLQRDAEGAWQVNERPDIAAENLAKLVSDWRRLEAYRIDPLDNDDRSAQLRIAVVLDDGTSHDLLVVSTDPDIEIVSPDLGLRYHFHREVYDRLITPAADEPNPA